MDLFERLVSWENLLEAARLARRRKPRSRELAEFEADREAGLAGLREDLISGAWRPGPTHSFRIYDPKPRLIAAAPYRDRVLHHALVRVLEPLWEPSFIHHSYACRRGKGSHRALIACSRFARRLAWVFRADVEKFYPSVDHEVLRSLIAARVRDPRVLAVIDRVLSAGGADAAPLSWFSGDDLFVPVQRAKGLPIGSLTSQFFANVILDHVDHRMTDDLGFGAYARYMDDVVVFGKTKARVLEARRALEETLEGLRLRLHRGKRNLLRSEDGIPFLGFRVFPHHRRLRSAGKARQGRRLRALCDRYRAGLCEVSEVRSTVMALAGHALWANAYYLRRTRASSFRFSRTGS